MRQWHQTNVLTSEPCGFEGVFLTRSRPVLWEAGDGSRDRDDAPDENIDELRRLARLCRSMAQARGILAVALVMKRRSRTVAGMDRQSLRE